MVCIGRHVGGHALALHGSQNYFLLISLKTFDSYVQMCYKRYHIIFSAFSMKFKCKICQKTVVHNFKNQVLVTSPAINFLILSKWCGFEKLNHYYFVLRDDPLTVFRRQNHVTFNFIKNDIT